MPICPLWTGLIIGPTLFPWKVNVTFTTSIVENWMKIVKYNILKNDTELRPGDFIRRIYEGISGRIKAFDFAILPISNFLLKKTKNGKRERLYTNRRNLKREDKRKSEVITNHVICPKVHFVKKV